MSKLPSFSFRATLATASALGRDITERKRADKARRELESNLAHVNRVSIMGQLAASLSHEITQPIAVHAATPVRPRIF